MRVFVSCHASIAALQPDPPEMMLPDGAATVSDVMARLGVPPETMIVAMLDGGPAWPDTPLRDGARLDLLPMVEGG